MPSADEVIDRQSLEESLAIHVTDGLYINITFELPIFPLESTTFKYKVDVPIVNGGKISPPVPTQLAVLVDIQLLYE